jgi:hypothetical protein
MSDLRSLLSSKIENFKSFLKEHSTKPDELAKMTAFTLEEYVAFACLHLIPLKNTVGISPAIETLRETLGLPNDKDILKKVEKYFNFFIDILEN